MPVFPRSQRHIRSIHELPDWPVFRWDHQALAAPLGTARHLQGRLIGHMEALGGALQEEAVLSTLIDGVVKGGEIDGENLDAGQVRSSVAGRLGMNVGGPRSAEPRVDRVVEMMLDATQRHGDPLTQERLFGWHASLFPTGRSGMRRIIVGAWRNSLSSGAARDPGAAPMQMVSGPVGRERVHVEVPAAARLGDEMRRFIEWFNTDATMEPVLKAALAHVWFVTIHPFDDGNGRIAHAIAELALARSENSARRFYSMSARIREERDDYNRVLDETQRGTLDITPWMQWFLACLTRAIEGAQVTLSGVLAKARQWEKLRDVPLNERQRLVINRLLEGFEGRLTTSKWAALTHSSQDTALRDIQQLVERGVLVRDAAGGRSTSYSMAGQGRSSHLAAPLAPD